MSMPAVVVGLYAPEEMQDFAPAKVIDLVPETAPAPKDPSAPAAATPPTSPASTAPASSEHDQLVDLVRGLCRDKPPAGLGWPVPHARAWLLKYFGESTPGDCTEAQLRDAKILLLDRMENEDAYLTRLELMAVEGRVLTGES